MRIFCINLAILMAVIATYSKVESGDIIGNTNAAIDLDNDGATVTAFLKNSWPDVLSLMRNHFDLSLKYLYTSQGYGSQKVQRPGMGKFLREQSQSHWNDGIEILKKYLQRGGDSNELSKHFDFAGKNQLSIFDYENHMGKTYLETVKETLKDSKKCAVNLNALHKKAERLSHSKKASNLYSTPNHDGDWAHFFQEKLENEAERTRKFAGLRTTLTKMVNSGMGLHYFDSYL